MQAPLLIAEDAHDAGATSAPPPRHRPARKVNPPPALFPQDVPPITDWQHLPKNHKKTRHMCPACKKQRKFKSIPPGHLDRPLFECLCCGHQWTSGTTGGGYAAYLKLMDREIILPEHPAPTISTPPAPIKYKRKVKR